MYDLTEEQFADIMRNTSIVRDGIRFKLDEFGVVLYYNDDLEEWMTSRLDLRFLYVTWCNSPWIYEPIGNHRSKRYNQSYIHNIPRVRI